MCTKWETYSIVLGGATRKLPNYYCNFDWRFLVLLLNRSRLTKWHRFPLRSTQYNSNLLTCHHQQNISYGNKIQHLAPSQDPFTHELYRSSSSPESDSSNTTQKA